MTKTISTPPPPRQQRSQKTFDALLEATVNLLDRQGLDACTLPRVATAAGVSAASVYRRFADKDDLLRAAFLKLSEANTPSATALEKELLRPTLQETAERVIGSLIRQHRTHPHLHHARSRFLEIQTNAAFATQLLTLIAANLQSLAAILLKHRDRIRHPEPERAASFAVLAAVSSIEAVATPSSTWPRTLALTDKQLCTELARAMVGYLRRKP